MGVQRTLRRTKGPNEAMEFQKSLKVFQAYFTRFHVSLKRFHGSLGRFKRCIGFEGSTTKFFKEFSEGLRESFAK